MDSQEGIGEHLVFFDTPFVKTSPTKSRHFVVVILYTNRRTKVDILLSSFNKMSTFVRLYFYTAAVIAEIHAAVCQGSH